MHVDGLILKLDLLFSLSHTICLSVLFFPLYSIVLWFYHFFLFFLPPSLSPLLLPHSAPSTFSGNHANITRTRNQPVLRTQNATLECRWRESGYRFRTTPFSSPSVSFFPESLSLLASCQPRGHQVSRAANEMGQPHLCSFGKRNQS